MWLDKEYYTSHIKDYEKAMKMRRVLDKIEIVMNQQFPETTDFFDPFEIYLAESILNRFEDIKYKVEGGFSDSERKSISIFPNYYDASTIPSAITILKVSDVADGLSHKDYLGSILNLGIKREKIGDILVHRDYGFIIVKEEIKDFILYNLEKISNKKVNLFEVQLDELEIPEIKYKEVSKFVKSLRLDSIISAALNLSRKDSMSIIKSKDVKVNWEPIDKGSKEIDEGDTISIRRYGRIILQEKAGLSKSGRIRCTIRILI